MRIWSAQKVVIIGAARQGLALARYLLEHGASVVITDQQPLEALASARQALGCRSRRSRTVELGLWRPSFEPVGRRYLALPIGWCAAQPAIDRGSPAARDPAIE